MSAADLQRTIQAVQPAAVLVTPSVLEKIVRQTLKLPGWMWTVPHRRAWIVERQFLFRFVEQEDLLVRPDQPLPGTLLLLETPARFDEEDKPEVLRSYWRLLFHATVDLELANQVAAGQWPAAAVEERIDRLGATVFNEIRGVLVQEHHLAPHADARTIYLEFVAVFLELCYFARPLLESYFPGIADVEHVKSSLEQDVAGAALFEQTRLAGASAPSQAVASSPHEAHEFFYELLAESDAAKSSGNLVRAAIQRGRAARVAPAAQAFDTRKQAVDFLEALLDRLQPALEIPPAELPEWSKHLPELLDKADQGSRPAEAYLLYDLQKVCLDYEREVYTLDLVEWVASGGKKPVRRPLSSQRLVRVTRHVRSAAQRLTMARLSDSDRKHFAGLLQAALARCQERVRSRFRPLLTSAIEDVGLAPRNRRERTAFLKLTDELLDRILKYGFLTFSELRDALARNQLKLPDLSDPHEFLRGDPLLRLDRRLATMLDGVYRRGEFYLRWLERFTALNFGTRLGRWITRFVTVPYLGAFLLLFAFDQFVLHLIGVGDLPAYVSIPAWLLLGTFLLGLLHSRAFRRRCADLGRRCWRPVKRVVVDIPVWVVRNTALMQILSSWSFQLFYWYLFKPLVLCAVLWLLLPETFQTWLQVALTFLAANFLVNSRPGLAVAEAVRHGVVRFYALLRGGLIPGLIRLVVQIFKQILHTMEAILFTVDEWLRFRAGDSELAMALRVLFGVLWFPIAYLARFNIVVLIEPCLNPVKFPVCAVATKAMALLLPQIYFWLKEIFTPILGPVVTIALATWIVFWLPDVFGFLFWEMKENWSLYAANQGPVLQPVAIGAHGETLRRLLRPGFHSGTVPKLFAKLRHAEQKALTTGNFSAVRSVQLHLEEVEEAVRLFVKREFLVLLEQEDAWQKQRLQVGKISLATNQVRVELAYAAQPQQPIWLEFADDGTILSAGMTSAPWLLELPGPDQRWLRYALTVLFQLGGAEMRPWPWPENRNGAVVEQERSRFEFVPQVR
jgi:hypothetical protein